MKKLFKKEEKQQALLPIRKFFAIRKLPLSPGDHHPPYQIEVASIQGGHVLSLDLLDKPDTLQMIIGKFNIIANPDSEENTYEEAPFLG